MTNFMLKKFKLFNLNNFIHGIIKVSHKFKNQKFKKSNLPIQFKMDKIYPYLDLGMTGKLEQKFNCAQQVIFTGHNYNFPQQNMNINFLIQSIQNGKHIH